MDNHFSQTLNLSIVVGTVVGMKNQNILMDMKAQNISHGF